MPYPPTNYNNRELPIPDSTVGPKPITERRIADLELNFDLINQKLKELEVKSAGQSSTPGYHTVGAQVRAEPFPHRIWEDLPSIPIALEVSDQDMKALEDYLDELDKINLDHNVVLNNRKKDLNKMATNSGWVTLPDGTRKCYKGGELHCLNGPAEQRPNGTTLFYKNGKLHREGGQPAMVGVRGTAKYAENGKYHRLGGLPAITWSRGPFLNEWWVDGEIQSAQKRDGTREWYAPGCNERDEAILHRLDGPAVIYGNGREEYWINGTQFADRIAWVDELNIRAKVNKTVLERELIDEDPIEDVQTKSTETVKEKKVMTQSFTEMMKANAQEAGYRVAGTQLRKLVKNSLIQVMKNKGSEGGHIQAFSDFLDTEIGEAIVSGVIGVGLNYVPHFGDDARVKHLAQEMQVAGMAMVGNAVLGEVTAHLLPAITEVLKQLPAADNVSSVRVEAAKENSKLVEHMMEEEEVEEPAPAAKQTLKA